MNILIVEDETDVAEVLAGLLEDLGNSCVVAGSAEQADRLLEECRVDCVTLDLTMPGRSGLDWLESVAVQRPDLARRTLVITGTTLGPENVHRLARCGAGLLAKPFTIDGLSEAVRCQLEHPWPDLDPEN
jgi:DNA-binding response OmpR family regulator